MICLSDIFFEIISITNSASNIARGILELPPTASNALLNSEFSGFCFIACPSSFNKGIVCNENARQVSSLPLVFASSSFGLEETGEHDKSDKINAAKNEMCNFIIFTVFAERHNE